MMFCGDVHSRLGPVQTVGRNQAQVADEMACDGERIQQGDAQLPMLHRVLPACIDREQIPEVGVVQTDIVIRQVHSLPHFLYA